MSSSNTLRVLLVVALVLVALAVVTSAYAQGTTTSGGSAAAATATATPRTLPRTGGDSGPASTTAVVLLALGATAGLGGLLLRGLRQPQ